MVGYFNSRVSCLILFQRIFGLGSRKRWFGPDWIMIFESRSRQGNVPAKRKEKCKNFMFWRAQFLYRDFLTNFLVHTNFLGFTFSFFWIRNKGKRPKFIVGAQVTQHNKKLWGWGGPADLVAGEIFASTLCYDENAGWVSSRQRVAVRAPRHLTNKIFSNCRGRLETLFAAVYCTLLLFEFYSRTYLSNLIHLWRCIIFREHWKKWFGKNLVMEDSSSNILSCSGTEE